MTISVEGHDYTESDLPELVEYCGYRYYRTVVRIHAGARGKGGVARLTDERFEQNFLNFLADVATASPGSHGTWLPDDFRTINIPSGSRMTFGGKTFIGK